MVVKIPLVRLTNGPGLACLDCSQTRTRLYWPENVCYRCLVKRLNALPSIPRGPAND